MPPLLDSPRFGGRMSAQHKPVAVEVTAETRGTTRDRRALSMTDSGPAPKPRTSTERVRRHRALKAALRDETQQTELRIPCTDLGGISEWLVSCGELSASAAEQPSAISKALATKIAKLIA